MPPQASQRTSQRTRQRIFNSSINTPRSSVNTPRTRSVPTGPPIGTWAARMEAVAVSEHKSSAPSKASVRVAVVSISDTRTVETDEGGTLVQTLTARAGFSVVARELVRDDPDTIRVRVLDLAAGGGVDAILLTGGTGIAPRDGTVDAVAPLFARRLDGFGELFRMLSFAEIGSAAMLSRATAGIVGGVAVFLMPGSPAGVTLALERLILPELPHLVGELRKPAAIGRTLDDAGEASSRLHPHRHGHDDRDRH